MLDTRIKSALELVTTATLTTVLLKKGLRNVWLRGARPLTPQDRRIVGEAFTLRFVPPREDLATPASWASPKSTRGALEAMPDGCKIGRASGRERVCQYGVIGVVADL